MDDVKPNAQVPAPIGTTGEETPQVDPQQPEQTTVNPEVPVVTPERTVPYGRFSEVNKSWKEAQRELAEYKREKQLSQFDPNDMNAVLSHPVVQEALIKAAKYELTDYTRNVLEQYPTLNPQVKKAILANVRGFVKEGTTDVESAKLDIQEYIESILEGEAPAAKKNFPVVATNTPSVVQPVKPAEVEKILAKSVDSWTDQEMKIVEDYTKTLPKK
jgi:hypothetical protein